MSYVIPRYFGPIRFAVSVAGLAVTNHTAAKAACVAHLARSALEVLGYTLPILVADVLATPFVYKMGKHLLPAGGGSSAATTDRSRT